MKKLVLMFAVVLGMSMFSCAPKAAETETEAPVEEGTEVVAEEPEAVVVEGEEVVTEGEETPAEGEEAPVETPAE